MTESAVEKDAAELQIGTPCESEQSDVIKTAEKLLNDDMHR